MSTPHPSHPACNRLERHTANPRTPFTITLGLVAALCVSACAQVHATSPVERRAATPWPSGWAEPTVDGAWPRVPPKQAPGLPGNHRHEPLWGVPTVSSPHATHCQRAPILTETGAARPSPQRHGGASTAPTGSAASTASASPEVLERKSAAPAASPPPMSSRDASAASRPSIVAAERSRLEGATDGSIDADDLRSRRTVERVLAGMVDDNADFTRYVEFHQRQVDPLLRPRDIAERYRVEVRDADGRPVPDAELALAWAGGERSIVWARADAGGMAWLHPSALVDPSTLGGLTHFDIQTRSPHGGVARAVLERGQKGGLSLTVPSERSVWRGRASRPSSAPVDAVVPLDVVFMVDATGSMGDEINKLRISMQSMAERIATASATSTPIDLCLGLVAFRDVGDEFVTRRWSLTNDLQAFQSVLGGLRAAGGGDEPEALNEALFETVHRMPWREAGTTRLVVMIGDAPPQMHRGGPYYDQTAQAALARGIKIHAVGASGLSKRGEAVFRSVAQTTGGRFVFLTYKDANRPGRGPGTQTPHDVRDYSVATLDDLIVRLVTEEVAKRRGT